jgi:hypothetical protein
MGQDATGAVVAFPPTTSSLGTALVGSDAESAVQVEDFEGDHERVSPVGCWASAIVTADNL